MNEPLYPYQYELLWDLMQHPRTAAQIAAERLHWRKDNTSPQAISNRLRPLVKRGWLRQVDGVYHPTARAVEAMSW